MSTTPTRDSEDEDDGDYVPPVGVDSESSEDESNPKHLRTTSPTPPQEDEIQRKQTRDALWSSFQASVAGAPSQPEPQTKMIKVQKRYKFAGEDVSKVVEVPIDSADAKKWPVWRGPEDNVASVDVEIPTPTRSDSHTPLKSLVKRLGPRKPKISLASLPTPSTQKVKKLSTLDKSAMDWQEHVQSAEVKDELEANRRGGGYIEKVEFLSRVEERRGEVIESSKGSKRRRL